MLEEDFFAAAFFGAALFFAAAFFGEALFLAAAFFGAAFFAVDDFLAVAFFAAATLVARFAGRLLPVLPAVRLPFFVFMSPFPIFMEC